MNSDCLLSGTYSAANMGDKVRQSPLDVISNKSVSAVIQCTHSIYNYNRILWYKQTGIELTLIGFLYVGTETLQTDFTNKVKLSGDANTGKTNDMTILALTLDDSAVYFCVAAYAQCNRWTYYPHIN